MHLEGREKRTAHDVPFKAQVADLRRRAERDLAAFRRQSDPQGCGNERRDCVSARPHDHFGNHESGRSGIRPPAV